MRTRRVIPSTPSGPAHLSAAPHCAPTLPAHRHPALCRHRPAHFFRPDGHLLQASRPVAGAERYVDHVASAPDDHPSDAGLVVACVEGVPASADEGLEPGVEVHWHIRWLDVDVGQIAEGVPGRDIQRTTERHRDQREVATHALALLIDVVRGRGRAARTRAIGDVARVPSHRSPAPAPSWAASDRTAPRRRRAADPIRRSGSAACTRGRRRAAAPRAPGAHPAERDQALGRARPPRRSAGAGCRRAAPGASRRCQIRPDTRGRAAPARPSATRTRCGGRRRAGRARASAWAPRPRRRSRIHSRRGRACGSGRAETLDR